MVLFALSAAFFMLPLPTPAAPPPEAGQPAACLNLRAELPLVVQKGRFLAQVVLNDQPVWMLIDTGARDMRVTLSVAEGLHLMKDTNRLVNVLSVSGKTNAYNPYIVNTVRLGKDSWQDVRALPDPGAGPPQATDSNPYAGVIGVGLLSRYDVELDFPDRTLRLYDAHSCAGQRSPWAGRYQAFKPERLRSSQYAIMIYLNGHPLRAVIDTGSNVTAIDSRTAAALGLKQDDFVKDVAQIVTGANAQGVGVRLHRFDALILGAETIKNPVISVQSATIPNVDMLLGMDVLAERSVMLSYSTESVFISGKTQPLR